jgi:hypothetical protein
MQAERQWEGGWLVASRLIWGVVFVICVVSFLLAIPYSYKMSLTPCTGADCLTMQPTQEALDTLVAAGLSPRWNAIWDIIVASVIALAYCTCALLLIWRRSAERAVWLFSLILVIVGTFETPVVDALVLTNRFGYYYVNIMNSIMWFSLALLFYTFPDGRFVPAWSWIGLLPLIALRASILVPASWPLYNDNWPGWLEPLFVLLIFGGCIAAQVYRYRRVSTPLQRQQTKWIVYGLIMMAMILVVISLGFEEPTVTTSPAMQVLFSFLVSLVALAVVLTLPVTVTIAILRYRLWDIDILIRRTLIYSVLTTILALIYFGSVVVLQTLWRSLTGQVENTFVTVLSTLAIAALFTPVRQRVQQVIDRRLYRRKYDADLVLLAFGELTRDETDLDRLTAELVRVGQETVQPAQVSIWLRKAPEGGNEA